MHPRNIYQNGHPDFGALAIKNAELAVYVFKDERGRSHIDFKNKAALRALTKALLLDDFNLKVLIPEDSLIPTVPLRLNYILWIEDLLGVFYPDVIPKPDALGIDVGTGATAIYSLLAAQKNKWLMVATEKNSSAYDFAVKNVEKNNLEKLVQVHRVRDDTIFKSLFRRRKSIDFDFTMCNPPFFSTLDETESFSKPKTDDRPSPSGAKSGIPDELIVQGGEEVFVKEMILESKEFAGRVKIFTTMIGVKLHLKSAIEELQKVEVSSYTTTEFVQGKTMRWGLAWTFSDEFVLPKPEKKKKVKQPTPLEYVFSTTSTVSKLIERMKKQMLDLSVNVIKEDNSTLTFRVDEVTWTNQRRKRREDNRNEMVSGVPLRRYITATGIVSTFRPPNSGEPESKRPKLENTSGSVPTDPYVQPDTPAGLIFTLKTTRQGTEGKIILEYLDGTFGRDAFHQIFQCLKTAISRGEY